MEYKVSYGKEFGYNGTVYTQRIKLTLSLYELMDKVNIAILEQREKLAQRTDSEGIKTRYFKPLQQGKNYVTLSLKDFIVKEFCNPNDKRIKDRNTIILVNLK